MANTSTSFSANAFKTLILGLVFAPSLALLAVSARTAEPTFYADDPIWTDDDMARDASKVVAVDDAGGYDFLVNTFGHLANGGTVRAGNVNTVDEVPDSSWFVNRIGRRELSLDEIRRAADRVTSISLDGWKVVGAKEGGVTPGFRMADPTGHVYEIKLDPPGNPEMSTGAEIIGAAFYHAFGYNTVDGYLTELDPEQLVIADGAEIFDPLAGKKRRLEMRDIHDVLRRGARRPDGKYRVLASRFADGKPLGNFRYYRTRPDDPNDIVPHENRRELRGARVFGAWLNHVDSRGINSLDVLIGEDGHQYIKHFMFDFGATLGSGTLAGQAPRVGNEYIFEEKPGWLTLATLGLYTRPWMHIHYPQMTPAVGRLEANAFEPARWKPEYPNPAFDSMRPDDAFWAARIVSKFTDQTIRAVVDKAQYSDPRTTDYLTGAIIKRRDKVMAYWLTQVNPLVDFALSDGGELTFANAAEQAGVASAATEYRVQWAQFDNSTGLAANVGDAMTVTDRRVQAPAPLVSDASAPEFIQVSVAAVHPQFPTWSTPVTLQFRRVDRRWTLVGLVRLPDASPQVITSTTSRKADGVTAEKARSAESRK